MFVCGGSKVKETKAELNGLVALIEEVRSVCRHLHTNLQQIPEITILPFESEADSLMDQWLDVSLASLLLIFNSCHCAATSKGCKYPQIFSFEYFFLADLLFAVFKKKSVYFGF